MSALLRIEGLRKAFPVRRGLLQRVRGWVRAVDGVSFEIHEGECFGLVGESGSGKTTLGRCILRLLEPTGGRIWFRGEDLLALSPRALRRRRRHFQMVFQDPYGSLNPRMRVGRILEEPLAVHGVVEQPRRRARVAELLEMVGLPPGAGDRYPHEFSGGQRQRIGIARALATQPALLIADEPVSALDLSIRAQLINLLAGLQDRLRLALLFIAHDLAVVEQLAHRVAVLYLGRVVELASSRDLFVRPQHPYTVSLLSAVPVPDPRRKRRRIVLPGEVPSPMAPPPGCPFHPRCPIARPHCASDDPPLREVRPGHWVACHYAGELTLEAAAGGGTF